jgi:hypothetical protein
MRASTLMPHCESSNRFELPGQRSTGQQERQQTGSRYAMGVQQMVNHIAQVLGRPVLVEDRKQRVLAYSPQSETIDEVRRRSILEHHAGPDVNRWLLSLGVLSSHSSVRVPSNREFNMLPRLCVPIWKSDIPLGYLWFIDAPSRMDEFDVARAHGLGSRLAEELYRSRVQQENASSRSSAGVRDLLFGTGPAVTHAAQELMEEGFFHSESGVRAMILRPTMNGFDFDSDELRDGLDRTVRAATHSIGSGNSLGMVRHDHAVLLVPSGSEPGRFPLVEKTAQQLVHAADKYLAPLPGVASTMVGVGGARLRLDQAQESYVDATSAADLGTSFDTAERVVQWDSLGAYRGVYSIASLGVAPSDIQSGFMRLLAEKDGDVLVKTAECYLNLGCRVQDAAAALNLHRTSLYYRLERIERIVGIDLRDGVERLGLHLALLLARLGPVKV